MKALITVINQEEARCVVKEGCDILDIKNPVEGSLGANYPWVIKEIVEIVPQEIEISIAIGDVPNLPGTVSMAVLGALQFKPDYIKVGLKGTKTKSEAVELMKKVVRTNRLSGVGAKIVAACYADYHKSGSVNLSYLPEIVSESGANIAMIDTLTKRDKNLLDFISKDELKKVVKICHEKGLKIALAGSLNEEHLEMIYHMGVDIFGVRGAVCSGGDRKSEMKVELVRELYSNIRQLD
ncbi:MAG: (5-formylfuran-3-yl)methyl phosphate synthase [Candidatus Saelkia tenebricola]|nr:(5-formylfuran-3-yl)methyl phosphate synthase [Candidatus Saelkia tenebricola]